MQHKADNCLQKLTNRSPAQYTDWPTSTDYNHLWVDRVNTVKNQNSRNYTFSCLSGRLQAGCMDPHPGPRLLYCPEPYPALAGGAQHTRLAKGKGPDTHHSYQAGSQIMPAYLA